MPLNASLISVIKAYFEMYNSYCTFTMNFAVNEPDEPGHEKTCFLNI